MICLNVIKSKIANNDILYRIVNGFFWSFFGSVLSKIVILISTMFVSRILGQENYGELGIVRSTVMMFVGIAGVGMGTTAAKFIAENKKKDVIYTVKMYFISNVFSLFIAIIVAGLVIITAPVLATELLLSSHLVLEIRIGALMMFFCIINGAQLGVLSGFEDFKSIAKVNIVTAFSEVVLLILGAYYWGVLGAIVGYCISFLITTFMNNIYIRRHINKLGVSVYSVISMVKISDFSVLYKFSLPIALSSLIMMPAMWWIKTYLIRTSGYIEMAIFDIADQWKTQILYIPAVLSGIILPILSSLNNSSKNNFWKVIKINFSVNIVITIILVLIILLVRKTILYGYGEEYVNHDFAFILLAFTAILISASNIMLPILITKNCVVEGLLFNMLSSVLIIGFGMYFININMGAAGLALSLLISYFIIVLIQLVYIYVKNTKWV